MSQDNPIKVRGPVHIPEKVPYAAIISKTKEEWAETPDLMSIKNVLYVYTNQREVVDPDTGESTFLPAIKIGDGMAYVMDLPFATMPITDEDIARWNENSGLQVRVDEEHHRLVFY